MPAMMTKHTSKRCVQSSASFGNKTEVMVFKVSYFYGSYKGQHCLSYNGTAKGKWKMCSTSTLSSTVLHARNMRSIIFQKWDLRALRESVYSPHCRATQPDSFDLCASMRVTHYMAFRAEVIFTEIHITEIINNLWSGATSKLASQIHSL